MAILMPSAAYKECTTCGESKDLANFTHGCSSCKPCRAAKRRADRAAGRGKASPEEERRYYLRRMYGMTLEEQEEQVRVQDFKCAICQNKLAEEASKRCIDHCHETGKVRGVLCRNCNTGLGKLGDNIEGVRRALDYLEKAVV